MQHALSAFVRVDSFLSLMNTVNWWNVSRSLTC